MVKYTDHVLYNGRYNWKTMYWSGKIQGSLEECLIPGTRPEI